MIDPEILQAIQDALDKRETDNQFQVTPIPSHVHNGTDSQQIDYNNLVNKPASGITSVTGTSNQVTASTTSGATTLSIPSLFIAPGQLATVLDNIGNSSSTLTIDFSTGNTHLINLNASCTFTFSNLNSGAIHRLILTQTNGGSHTVTWPTMKWASALSPLLSTAANSIDIISLVYDGTNIYGTYSLNFG